MRLFSKSKDVIVSGGIFLIAVVILTGIPLKRSSAKNTGDISFGDAVFTHPLIIDNTYMPLFPGDTYIYSAETEDGTEQDTVTVTNQDKYLGGVDCRAVSDVVTLTNDVLDHVPTEVTTDWYAQDDDGDVWYCGEDTIEYFFDDAGNPDGSSTEGTWNADMTGAIPGVVMLADPDNGDSYQQEYLDGIAEDMAKVLRLNDTVSINLGEYENCLVTKEWTPLEKGSEGQKAYYPGLGMITDSEISGGKTVHSDLVEYLPAT